MIDFSSSSAVICDLLRLLVDMLAIRLSLIFRSANWWVDINSLQSAEKERLGYSTQKPESLFGRIIEASSNKYDTILDAYCGCGTTVAVAERLKRKWIGIDNNYHAIELTVKRLEDNFPLAIYEVWRQD